MRTSKISLGVMTGLGLLALSGTASAGALTCVNTFNERNPQSITVDSSSACANVGGNDSGVEGDDTQLAEPGTLLLLGLGLVAVVFARRRMSR